MIEILVASRPSLLFEEVIVFFRTIGNAVLVMMQMINATYDGLLLELPLNLEHYLEQGGINFHSVQMVIYTFSLYLIVLKFVKKLFDVYALQVDGDPNAEINTLITNFFKAMVMAMSFTTIWSWIFDIVRDFGTELVIAINEGAAGQQNSGAGIIKAINIGTIGRQIDSLIQLCNDNVDVGSPNTILIPIYIFLAGIMFVVLFKNAVEFWLVRLGVPLACCGLLDADQGLFKQYTKILLKEILTILIRVFMLHVSLRVLAVRELSIFNLCISISALIVGFTTPKILSELLIQQQQGGRFMNTVYMGAMVLRGVI